MKSANLPINYNQYSPGQWEAKRTEVIVETPVSLTVNGEIWLTFMCTPVHLEALAIGFLFNEGLIVSLDDIADVRLCAAGDNVDVWTNHELEKPGQWRRTSGCTGGMTSVANETRGRRISNGGSLPAGRVGELVAQLFESQELYKSSGGVHTSALSDGKRIILTAEDIGRHNTLDKLAGRMLLEEIRLMRKIILTTGRISSEMLQKSHRMGVSIVISRTSPSSLSIELAENLGVTLVGYARRNRFNVYTHPQRILLLATSISQAHDEHILPEIVA
ncbi:MAG: formate dehydrogenase family accessory protein FdhD [Chloroflexi bacterium RBG_16_52_11]|nr:MAG: formate dehydrogenase family accessory protein FdhD [Chloroflexi bacterium RBG_16_52_11]